MLYELEQTYHLEPPTGLMNDPNGLVYFRGNVLVFFQWNPKALDHNYKQWGLFSSNDLVRWQFEGPALVPSESHDHSGVYSGSALEVEGRLHLFYTGNDRRGNVRLSHQAHATSEDGRHFAKQGVVLETPPGFTDHVRDPKVFEQPVGYGMVLGAQRASRKGAVVWATSPDAEHWQYDGLLAVDDACEMIECPDYFELDGHRVLTFCPQRRDAESDEPLESWAAWHMVDAWKPGDVPADLSGGSQYMDAGWDFYAPQSFAMPDGRRIVLAWMSRMSEAQEQVFAKDAQRIHCLTIPRELFVREGRLCQRPARELGTMLKPIGKVKLIEEGEETIVSSRAYRLLVEGVRPEQLESALRIELESLRITWSEGKLTVRRFGLPGGPEERFSHVGCLRQLEIWADQSSCEVFVNDGEAVYSARTIPQTNAQETKLRISCCGMRCRCELREVDASKLIVQGGTEHD